MVDGDAFHNFLRFSQVARADVELQPEAAAGEGEGQQDDRRDNLEDGDSAGAHCGNFVVRGEAPEHEHDGDERRPWDRERHSDGEHVEHEFHGGSDIHAVGNVFKDLDETGARHAECQHAHCHDKRIQKAFCDVKIQCFEHSLPRSSLSLKLILPDNVAHLLQE